MIFYGVTVFGRFPFLLKGKFTLFGLFLTEINRFCDLCVKYPLFVSLQEMRITNLIKQGKTVIYGNKGYFQEFVKKS